MVFPLVCDSDFFFGASLFLETSIFGWLMLDGEFPENGKVSGRTTLIKTGCSILFPVFFEP